MAKLVIHDVAEVIIRDKATQQVAVMGEAQLAGITSSITSEEIRGGIGNKVIYIMRSDKTFELAVRSATFDSNFMAMSQGVTIENGSAIVAKVERLKVAGGTVTILGTPVGDTVRVEAPDGDQEDAAVATKEVTVPIGLAADGDEVVVTYDEEVTGNILSFDATKFPNKFEITYRTISYNVADGSIYADVYFVFDEAMPSGEFNLSLESGSAYAPELNFTVTTAIGSDVMGRMIEVPREK